MKTFFQCKEEKWAITRFIFFFRKNCTFSDVAMVLSIMSTLMTLYIKILKRIREAIFFHLCPYFFLTVLHIACFHDIIAMFNSYPRCLLLLRYTLKCWSRYNFFFHLCPYFSHRVTNCKFLRHCNVPSQDVNSKYLIQQVKRNHISFFFSFFLFTVIFITS